MAIEELDMTRPEIAGIVLILSAAETRRPYMIDGGRRVDSMLEPHKVSAGMPTLMGDFGRRLRYLE